MFWRHKKMHASPPFHKHKSPLHIHSVIPCVCQLPAVCAALARHWEPGALWPPSGGVHCALPNTQLQPRDINTETPKWLRLLTDLKDCLYIQSHVLETG